MMCYECFRKGIRREAVGLCHHCSAALCEEHAAAISRPVTRNAPISKVILMPLPARELLCPVCLPALTQTSGDCATGGGENAA
jgi:hypothetical protein